MNNYSAQIRAERFIAIGRTVLAPGALTAISAMPSAVLHAVFAATYASERHLASGFFGGDRRVGHCDGDRSALRERRS